MQHLLTLIIMFRQGPYGWKMYCKQGLHMWGNSLESWNSCFTNAYLAYKYFESSDLVHTTFKMALSEQLIHYQQVTETHPRQSLMNVHAPEYNSHVPVKLDHPKPCRHGFAISECKTTTFQCGSCKVPLHKSSYKHSNCWDLHFTHGLPAKRRSTK